MTDPMTQLNAALLDGEGVEHELGAAQWMRVGLVALVALALVGCDAGGSETDGPERRGAQESTRAGNVRLYVVDRYEGVRRLDPYTLEVIDSIDTGPRAHGLVASADGRTLYITLEVANEVNQIAVIDPDAGEGRIGRDQRAGRTPLAHAAPGRGAPLRLA